MLYVDDAGFVSHTPEQLNNLMGVVVIMCATFGLTVSEAKIEITCLRTKGVSESAAIFSVEAADRVYKHYQPVYRGQPAHTQRMVQRPEACPRILRPTERSPRAKNPDAKSRGTRDNNAVWLHHVESARVPLQYAAPSPPQLPD